MGYKNGRVPTWQKAETYNRSEVGIPEKIKCDRCRKWKGSPNFSNKQLDELRKKLLKARGSDLQDAATAVCRACTGGSSVELQCNMCDKIKGLDDFAKAQRSKGDNARCKTCMNKQVAMEPAAPAAEPGYLNGDDDELDEDSDSDESEVTNQWEPTDEELRMNHLSLHDGSDITSNYSETTSMATADSGGVSLGEANAKSMLDKENVWQVKQTKKQPSVRPSDCSTVAATMTTLDRAPYSQSSSAATTYSQGDANTKGRTGWAKVPKAPQPQVPEEESDDDDLYDDTSDDDDDGWHTKAATSDGSSSDGFSDI